MVEWRRYHGVIVSNKPPHIEPSQDDIERAKKMKGYRFISYVTDYDCEEELPWWYVIKDTPIILEDLPANRRYKIKKGLRYVEIRKIDCKEYSEELYSCYLKAQQRYKAHEDHSTKESFLRGLQNDRFEYYGAFFVETNQLVAYMKTIVYSDCVSLSVIKYDPEYLRYQTSAALTYSVVYDYLNVRHYRYVMDGQRAIRHKTNIQEYLEQYFGFRKAYCKLNLIYSPAMKVAVILLYPFRKLLARIAGDHVFLNNIVSVLMMEEIKRACHAPLH